MSPASCFTIQEAQEMTWQRIGPEPRQTDSPAVAGLSDYRKFRLFTEKTRQSAATNQLHQHFPWGESCRSAVALLCALGLGVDFVAQQQVRKIKFWSWDRIFGAMQSQFIGPGQQSFGHRTVSLWGCKPKSNSPTRKT